MCITSEAAPEAMPFGEVGAIRVTARLLRGVQAF
jgi:hypothetical protein